MSYELPMMIRGVDAPRRQVEGVVAPYDETTLLVPLPGGECLRRGCFTKSIAQRGGAILLNVNHNADRPVGKAVAEEWRDDLTGLRGVFAIRENEDGDRALADVMDGYLTGLSVGFGPLPGGFKRNAQGAVEHHEARLVEVSLVPAGAYAGGLVTNVRSATQVREDLLAPFRNPPAVNLTPIPRAW